MNLVRVSPTETEIPGELAENVRKALTYTNTSIAYQYVQAKNNRGLMYALGTEAYEARVQALKDARKQCLLKQRPDGTYYTMSGLEREVSTLLGIGAVSNVVYPEKDIFLWVKEPYSPRPYQTEALNKLMEVKHGSVQIGTGLGKTLIIELLVKNHGMKTVVMTPSVSIATQILSDFTKHFGKKLVGAFFDGKKNFKKQIVVAVAASLARVEEGTEAWTELSKAQVFIADESHLCPAETLANVCLGLVKDAPYRFFFSGTQTRGDGADLLLKGIIGPIVYTMTVEEGVEQGWLAKPNFIVIGTISTSSYESTDIQRMARKHFYYNPRVLKHAAEIANRAYSVMGHQVLILVNEMEQFAKLAPLLKHPHAFAHGGVTEDNRDKLPACYHKSDPTALVESFNAGELPILIGTSCIATGTDIRNCTTVIFLMGGSSEVKFKQAVGRGTRKIEGKVEFFFFDFDVTNQEALHRHALNRMDYMREIYPSVKYVERDT